MYKHKIKYLNIPRILAVLFTSVGVIAESITLDSISIGTTVIYKIVM